MNLFCSSALIVLLNSASIADQTSEFSAKRYQRPDGAITVYADGDNVDPYFATKALLAAQSHGLDIRRSAVAWIAWLMPRQLSDGRFERYCRALEGVWRGCESADADDALLALWLELLHSLSPNEGLPARWRESARLAEQHLANLRDSKLGVYHVSREKPIALFIDNVEIYASLASIARDQRRFGNYDLARRTATRAANLRGAIDRAFWQSTRRRYQIALNKEPEERFYPDIVAQTYPWFAGLDTPAGNKNNEYVRWREQYAAAWLTLQQDEFPWGLLALVSLQFKDRDTAFLWFERATPLRHSNRWNILEEAAYQVIGFDLCCKSGSQIN